MERNSRVVRVANEANRFVVQQITNEICHYTDVGKDKNIIIWRKALKAVCTYPHPLQTREEAKRLPGIGDFLARKIEAWAKQKPAEGAAAPTALPTLDEREPVVLENPGPPPSQLYAPRPGKGPWFVMMSVYLASRQTCKPVYDEEAFEEWGKLAGGFQGPPTPAPAAYASAAGSLVTKGIIVRGYLPAGDGTMRELSCFGLTPYGLRCAEAFRSHAAVQFALFGATAPAAPAAAPAPPSTAATTAAVSQPRPAPPPPSPPPTSQRTSPAASPAASPPASDDSLSSIMSTLSQASRLLSSLSELQGLSLPGAGGFQGSSAATQQSPTLPSSLFPQSLHRGESLASASASVGSAATSSSPGVIDLCGSPQRPNPPPRHRSSGPALLDLTDSPEQHRQPSKRQRVQSPSASSAPSPPPAPAPAPVPATSSSAFPSPPSQWSCAVCTLDNDSHRMTCAVCETPRPAASTSALPPAQSPPPHSVPAVAQPSSHAEHDDHDDIERMQCMFGEQCYRVAKAHFQFFAHAHLAGKILPSNKPYWEREWEAQLKLRGQPSPAAAAPQPPASSAIPSASASPASNSGLSAGRATAVRVQPKQKKKRSRTSAAASSPPASTSPAAAILSPLASNGALWSRPAQGPQGMAGIPVAMLPPSSQASRSRSFQLIEGESHMLAPRLRTDTRRTMALHQQKAKERVMLRPPSPGAAPSILFDDDRSGGSSSSSSSSSSRGREGGGGGGGGRFSSSSLRNGRSLSRTQGSGSSPSASPSSSPPAGPRGAYRSSRAQQLVASATRAAVLEGPPSNSRALPQPQRDSIGPNEIASDNGATEEWDCDKCGRSFATVTNRGVRKAWKRMWQGDGPGASQQRSFPLPLSARTCQQARQRSLDPFSGSSSVEAVNVGWRLKPRDGAGAGAAHGASPSQGAAGGPRSGAAGTMSLAAFPTCMRVVTASAREMYSTSGGQAWEVVCLIDQREKRALTDARGWMLNGLKSRGVLCEMRQLTLGDLLWVVRRRSTEGPVGEEYVMSFIIERKQASDLAQSIMDGRYEEQKYRLSRCGLANVFYVVEGSLWKQDILSEEALRTAMLTTETTHGFVVRHTASTDNTLDYIAALHRNIQKAFDHGARIRVHENAGNPCSNPKCDLRGRPGMPLVLRTLKEFMAESAKARALTVREILGRQLRQVLGCSAAKTVSILSRYSTPRFLREGLISASQREDPGTILKDLPVPGRKTAVGGVLSALIHRLLTRPYGEKSK